MSLTRVLPLEGGCNFRDFGGYRTSDGRTVRWRRLFRSGVLTHLSAPAVAEVGALGIRTVCDLRRTEERARHPNPPMGPDVQQLAWDTATETSPIRDQAFAAAATIDEARTAMIVMYQRIPFRMQQRLAGAFEALERAGEGGCIVHCSAGKDRTGVAVALILATLGVPQETIVADYLLTNDAVDLAAQLRDPTGTGIGFASTATPIRALTGPAQAAVLDANEQYIRATLDAIATRCGSIEAYLRDELNIDDARTTRLRTRLLVH
jgi:protein-tyrosine phosphatase